MTYDSWLHQPYLDDDKRTAAIDKEVELLLLNESEFNPNHAATFMRALAEGALDQKQAELQHELSNGSLFAGVGRVIWQAVYDFCCKEAEQEAAHRYNIGLCGDDRE